MPIASTSTEIGTELPLIRMAMSNERFARWYGRGEEQLTAFPVHNLHIDQAAAEAEGLPAPVAAGPDIANLIFRSLREFFGEGWICGGKVALTIARPTFPWDFVTAKGVVREKVKEGAITRLVCDVWAENQEGEKKVVGTASGLVN